MSPAGRGVDGATNCRSCAAPLELTVVDLGNSPLCESLVSPGQLEAPETYYPLHVRICTNCWLAQLPAVVEPGEIFAEYAYFSAYSESWVAHASSYVDMIVDRLALTSDSFVVELASNDGYLLQHFLPNGIPVLGVDPALNVAHAAEARGVATVAEFFGAELAERLAAERGRADLVIANNVLAQVPDLNDFVEGVAILLAQGGTATFEFPHLDRLLDGLQYDTIYHEHFSYFSLLSVDRLMTAHELRVVDVEEMPSHGGSLRVYVEHFSERGAPTPSVDRIIAREEAAGLRDPVRYSRFADRVMDSKRSLLSLLIDLKGSGKRIAGYGAPGKGNTLLNFCGIRTDFLEYTVDRNPYKHGKFTPGTHIPIHPPERLAETQPAAILILPWNLAREIRDQLAYTADWGAKLVVPVPTPTVFEPG